MCQKAPEYCFLSDDQLLVISLLPNNDFSNKLIEKTIHLKNSTIITKNVEKLFKILNSIEKVKNKVYCQHCNKEFNLIMDLKKHIILDCFVKELNEENEEYKSSNILLEENNEQKILNIDNSNSSNIFNISNSNYNNCEFNTVNTVNTGNTINNTINFNLEIKNPISFDNKWDLSLIDDRIKNAIALSKFMYTNLLEEILNNELNLNVILDNDNNSGMVYKNDLDKYIKMKSKDIVENTMKKLNEHLIEINKNDTMSTEEFVQQSKENIIKKYIGYEKSATIQKEVESKICHIFENKKTDAMNLAEKIMLKSIKEDGF
jgi:hypothetical protein